MLQNKIFSNILKNTTTLALSGAFIASLTPSIIWSMDTQEDQRCAPINRVPKQVLGHSFSFIDQPTPLGRLSLVSKTWKEVSEMDIHWKRFGVESKKEFAKFMKSPAINIFNELPIEHFQFGIACGEGPYTIQDDPYFMYRAGELAGVTFNEYMITLCLPTDKETIVRFCDFPETITCFGPKKIYGVTFIPTSGSGTNTYSLRCTKTESGSDMISRILGESKGIDGKLPKFKFCFNNTNHFFQQQD